MKVSANCFDRLWAECGAEFTAAVSRVGRSGRYILGEEVAAFEVDLANYCGSQSAVGCANGTDALEIALRVSGIGPGDRVLTTPLSFFATCLAILRVGAEPVFCDVNSSGLIDPDAVAQSLESDPGIRGLIPVHLYGHLADMDRLQTLAADKNLVIIEDAAQAIGARCGQNRAGGNKRIACLSFYPTKNLSAFGDGGALILDDAKEDQLARSIRNYGQSSRFVHDELGLNSRLDELHAATLCSVFLPRLETWLSKRRKIAKNYLSRITNPHVTLVQGPDPDGAGWHLFPVLVAPDRRSDFLAHLSSCGVEAAVHYPVLMPEQKVMKDLGTPTIFGNLGTARRFADGEVSLPINPYLTEAEQDYVIDVVEEWGG